MKKFINKHIIKRISYVLIVLVLMFNFITPNYSHAGVGGMLLEPISDFILFLTDALLGYVEEVFVGSSNTKELANDETSDVNIRYSPGVIFSGSVPALSIDFLGVTSNGTPGGGTPGGGTQTYGIVDVSTLHDVILMTSKQDAIDTANNWLQNNGYSGKKVDDYDINIKELQSCFASGTDIIGAFMNGSDIIISTYFNSSTNIMDKYIVKIWKADNYTTYTTPASASSTQQMTSIASELSPFIAKWYYAIRTVALVGLLSVLLYVGIRIVLSSSAQNESKYKKMLVDWLAAVCILFVLHYGMALMIKCTDMITDFLSASTINSSGTDTLMTNVRTEIESASGSSSTWYEVISRTAVYVGLVVLTLIFTWQYLKRVVYVAFLTLIAPLIALTYPLDKLKDGKAQAFGMWLKEYMFNCLIQPVHLLLYIIFISSAEQFVTTNPLYALVAIGFMVPAEKFFKEMFGMSSKTSVGTLGAAAGGALAMSVLSKFGKKSSSKSDNKSGGGSSGGGDNGKVRTANAGTNVYAGLPNSTNGNSSTGASSSSNNTSINNAGGTISTGEATSSSSSGGTSNSNYSSGNSGGNTYSFRNTSSGGTQTASNRAQSSSGGGTIGGRTGGTASAQSTPQSNASNSNSNRPRGIRGAANAVSTKYFGNTEKRKNTAFKVARGLAKAGLAGTGMMVGAGIGLATGDPSKMFTYAGGGATAGMYAGGNIVNKTEKIVDNVMGGGAIRQGWSGMTDEEYANAQFDKKFFRSESYESIRRDEEVQKNLRYQGSQGRQNLRQDTQKYLNAGITDTKKIKKAMGMGIAADEAIGYISLASKCPQSAVGDADKFYKYVSKNTSIGITDKDVSDKIWNSIQPFI